MPRRFASQVHLSMSRLLRSGFVHDPPAWFSAVMQYPPIPTPSRATPMRTAFDTVAKKGKLGKKWARPSPDQVTFLEDKVRRQFFKDHPFEAFRARSIVETNTELAPLHRIQGSEWTQLVQHGRNPSPEDAVDFALCLHKHHGKSLTEAYRISSMQFRGLRSEHQIATAFAAQEAEYYGAKFGPGEMERGFEKEREAISSFLPSVREAAKLRSKLPWTSEWQMPGLPQPPETWTQGRAYAERVAKGELPNYSPTLPREEKAEPSHMTTR